MSRENDELEKEKQEKNKETCKDYKKAILARPFRTPLSYWSSDINV